MDDSNAVSEGAEQLHQHCKHVSHHIPSMDEPSAQLQLDLSRAVQHELASRRPLLHRLHGSGWVLQLPRPANAVRHGSRFYYNILVDPCFARQTAPSKSWFAQPSPVEGHLQTIAALEELLRDLEVLTGNLRSQSKRRSNFTVEDEVSRLETLVDAVAVTALDESSLDTYRDIHPDVPVFASQETIERISQLEHFRTLGTMTTFGNDRCMDWRSTTAVAGMPEWVGMGLLPQEDNEAGLPAALFVAFNNHHNNRAIKLAGPKSSAGSRQKRHAAILPNEEEDSAEAIMFSTRTMRGDAAVRLATADPCIHLLAEVQSSLKLAEQASPVVDGEHACHDSRALQTAQPTYRISERNAVIDKGKGFLAWLIAKATFSAKGEGKEDLQKYRVETYAEDDSEESERITLGHGESLMLS